MAKTEVYSWRLSRETKIALEDRARQAGKSLGQFLEHIAHEWLSKSEGSDDAALRVRVIKCAGSQPAPHVLRRFETLCLTWQPLDHRSDPSSLGEMGGATLGSTPWSALVSCQSR